MVDLASRLETVIFGSIVDIFEPTVALAPDRPIPANPFVLVGQDVFVVLGGFRHDGGECWDVLGWRGFIARTVGANGIGGGCLGQGLSIGLFEGFESTGGGGGGSHDGECSMWTVVLLF